MAISLKKIGGREYAYYAFRRGEKVVQEYLGPAKDPAVIARIAAMKKENHVPPKLHSLFWDMDPEKLDLRRHSRYIIERILDFGDMNAFWWAQRQYPTSMIIEVCHGSRRLSERSKSFWSIWFGANAS